MKLRDTFPSKKPPQEPLPASPPMPTFTIPPPAELADASAWLKQRLALRSVRVGDLVREYVGSRNGADGRWIADLMAARWLLKIVVVIDLNDMVWWALPGVKSEQQS